MSGAASSSAAVGRKGRGPASSSAAVGRKGSGASRTDWSAIDQRIRDLRAKDLTFAEIGKIVGVSATAVGRRYPLLAGGQPQDGVGKWQPSSDLLRIRQTCADAFGITDAQITAPSRVATVSHARMAACYIIRRIRPGLSYPCIGQMFGGRDHSTMIHACRTTEARMERDPDLAAKIAALVNLFGTRADARQHDSHIVQWREYERVMIRQQAEAAAWREDERRRQAKAEAEARLASDDIFESARDPQRRFCEQCDRSVRPLEAARCSARLCGLRPKVAG